MFPDFGKLASLLKNAPEMIRQAKQFRGRMDELQEKLGKLRVEGVAGGGMVKVTLNGHQKVIGVKLDPEVVQSDDCEMLEDLVAAAVNQAIEKSRTAATDEMGRLMNAEGGMPGGLGAAFGSISGLGDLPDLGRLMRDMHAVADDDDDDDDDDEFDESDEDDSDDEDPDDDEIDAELDARDDIKVWDDSHDALSDDDDDEDEDDDEPPKKSTIRKPKRKRKP